MFKAVTEVPGSALAGTWGSEAAASVFGTTELRRYWNAESGSSGN
jgi:hypothetical protein